MCNDTRSYILPSSRDMFIHRRAKEKNSGVDKEKKRQAQMERSQPRNILFEMWTKEKGLGEK